MKPFFIILMALMGMGTKSQVSFSKDSLRFRAQQWVGHLEGANGSAFQFNTVAGVSKGVHFLGIGGGIDWYHFRSIPVYLSYQRVLPWGGGRFFVNGDAGVNYNWAPPSVRSRWNDFVSDRFFPSTYLESGLNYRTFFKNKRDALLFHLGLGYKRLKEDKELPGTCLVPPCGTVIEHYDYQMTRLSVKLGWEF